MTDLSHQTVRAVRAELPLARGATLDCYELQVKGKELRVGFGGTSLAVGHEINWLGRLQKGNSRRLEALRREGFTGLQIEVSVSHSRGTSLAKTLSIDDFVKVVTIEAMQGKNMNAIILLASFARKGIEETIKDLFKGRSTEYIREYIEHYTRWGLSWEQWQTVLQEMRGDVEELRLGL